MDTEENQLIYPQPNQQNKGCGFPVIGICGVVNLSHGGWELLADSLEVIPHGVSNEAIEIS